MKRNLILLPILLNSIPIHGREVIAEGHPTFKKPEVDAS